MSEIMIPARGCVYMPRGSRAGSGFYKLEPALVGPADSPILIEGIDAAMSDIVYPVSTLDEKQYMFVMGQDFGNITVQGVALLGRAELNGQSLKIVREYWDSHRSSAKDSAPISASLPGDVKLKFYLTGIAISKPDAEFHIQFYQLRGIVAEPKAP